MKMMNVNKLCWWVHVLLWSYPGATNMMSSYQVLPSLFTPAVSWVCEDREDAGEQGGWWNTVTRAMPTLAPDHSVSMTRIRGNKALSEIIVDGVIKLSENLGREAAVDGKETSVIFVESSVLHRSLRTLWNQRRVPLRRDLSPGRQVSSDWDGLRQQRMSKWPVASPTGKDLSWGRRTNSSAPTYYHHWTTTAVSSARIS